MRAQLLITTILSTLAVTVVAVFGIVQITAKNVSSSIACESYQLQEETQVLGKKVKSDECTTIQDGELETTDGRIITNGYDGWGYNYQAHMFNGFYCDSYRDAAWCQSYKDVRLMMKWNNAWLSNKDCDDDGLLDRHLGFDSYIGSGAWLTNHQSGEYTDEAGNGCNWNYFVKIVAAPADATKENGVWHASDGKEIGPVIWGDFATIQQVSNDRCGDEHGMLYKNEAPSGFGFYRP